MHALVGQPRRAAVVRPARATLPHFAWATLVALGLVFCFVHGSARADSAEARAASEPVGKRQVRGKDGRGDRRAGDRKPTGKRPKSASANETQSARDRACEAVCAKDYALAERLIRKGLAACQPAERDSWHLVDSELALGRKRYAQSGLIAMRIVILRPKSDQVGAALYCAGLAYEGLGRLDKAAELYGACKDHPTTRTASRKKAEQHLRELTERQPQP